MQWANSLYVAGLGFLLLVSGCNVGPAFRDGQGPAGPVVSDSELYGTNPGSTAADSPIVEEVDLVEAVMTHRSQYHRALRQLRDYYQAHGYTTKADWAAFELKGLQRVKPFRYIIDAEVPPAELQASESIPAADDLYERGRSLMRQGGESFRLAYNQDTLLEAAKVFKHLIHTYPTSDKIDDAAFELGEIHRVFFKDQMLLAARWYERAFQWDPATPHPARFRAAQVYDHQLRDRARALELYHAVVQDGLAGERYASAATRRIRQLSKDPQG